MSKLFKSHAPKPVGSAAGTARTPRGKAVPREKLDQAAREKAAAKGESKTSQDAEKIEEIGGPEGPEPTRYGDWEIKGRCIDF